MMTISFSLSRSLSLSISLDPSLSIPLSLSLSLYPSLSLYRSPSHTDHTDVTEHYVILISEVVPTFLEHHQVQNGQLAPPAHGDRDCGW